MSYKQFNQDQLLDMWEDLSDVFMRIESARSLDDIAHIGKTDFLESFRFDEHKYPELQFRVKPEEIYDLMKQGEIDEDCIIRGSSLKDPLARLMYAVLWKQGDLLKVKHIIKGILANEMEPQSALVFYQFGKHLASADEPIIDQHVLRAFSLYKYMRSGQNSSAVNISALNKYDIELIKEYKHWIWKDLNEQLRKVDKYAYHVDKLMFSIGKYIKSKFGNSHDDIVYSRTKTR